MAKKIDESQQSTKLLPHAIHAQQQAAKVGEDLHHVRMWMWMWMRM